MRKKLAEILGEATTVAPLQVGTMTIESHDGRLAFYGARWYLFSVTVHAMDSELEYNLRNYTEYTWTEFRRHVRNALRKRG